MALTTELESVNQMLGHIGEAPVNSLADTAALPISASTALTVLREVSKEVQTEEWHFNTVTDYEPVKEDTGKLRLPDETLFVDSVDTDMDVVQRGYYLYNRKDRTDVFSETFKVDLTVQLTWDELPEVARRYVTLRASRIFQGRIVGSTELQSLIAVDEMQARARLLELDAQSSDRTIFDSEDVYRRIGVQRNLNIY
ncbi:MAG: phage tail protein [Rhodobacteraceae bacterium]|nr:phage tail protein [Paracoccaceae bacterium]